MVEAQARNGTRGASFPPPSGLEGPRPTLCQAYKVKENTAETPLLPRKSAQQAVSVSTAHSEENPYGWHFAWAISSEGLILRALGARHSKSLLLRMVVVPNGLGEIVC